MGAVVQNVSFDGDALQAVQHDDGRVYVVLKRACEALGIDDRSQREKLKEKPWAVGVLITSTGPDGKNYEAFCLDLDSLPMWLATIDAGRVAEHAREKLIRYQRECARALRDHFFGQRQAPPSLTLPSPHDGARVAAELAQRLLLNVPGVAPGIAAAAGLAVFSANTNIDMEPARKLLPGLATAAPSLNASDIGKKLGMGARAANSVLFELGLQAKNAQGDWELTELGKEHGEAIPYSRNGHAGYQVRWRPSVLEVVQHGVSKTG
jgi:hypothetical protein